MTAEAGDFMSDPAPSGHGPTDAAPGDGTGERRPGTASLAEVPRVAPAR